MFIFLQKSWQYRVANRQKWCSICDAKRKRSEVKQMEMRVVTALYAYPQLDRIGRDYEEHIKNKALLSYGSKMATEKLTEYIAEEIVRRQNVWRLKAVLDKIIFSLTEEEKILLDVRYFGKVERVRRLFAAWKAGLCSLPFKPWSERTYYRKQARLLKRIVSQVKQAGVDEKRFDEECLSIEYIAMLYQYLALGKEVTTSQKERQLLCFLKEIK